MIVNYNEVAELLFPNLKYTVEDINNLYPSRNLPEGSKVTRLAPSPTGFMHFGTLFPAIVNERLAHQSNGVFYLRIEDTDSKREVKGAEFDLINTLSYYKINFDEGASLSGDVGIYGPYRQSLRSDIYQTFAKKLVSEGKAYPVFTSVDEYNDLMNTDKKELIHNKDWHSIDEDILSLNKQHMRDISLEEVKNNLKVGNPFIIRIKSDGDGKQRFFINDLIKGKLDLPVNDEDFVLLKSDGIPTYHFAHAIDDHFMGTTHVIRGEEWLPSLPKHIQLFKYLGFNPPKYMHISQLMKMDGNSKKKLSKRDNGAALSDYKKNGYAPEAVIEYIMTLLNSNFEEWRNTNPSLPYTDFPFSIKKMSPSGALFDFDKLNDVSKNVLSRMSADTIYDYLVEWTSEYDSEFNNILKQDSQYAKKILSIGKNLKKPRKDLCTWKDAKPLMSIFYDSLFAVSDDFPDKFDKNDILKVLVEYNNSFNYSDDNSEWFEKVKVITDNNGFCSDMKLFKNDPDKYKGNISDVSSFIRIALTGRLNSPDLYDIIHIIGAERSKTRIINAITKLKGSII